MGGWQSYLPAVVRVARRLVPRRRPLDRLNFCEAGAYKVHRADDGRRSMVLEPPLSAADECSVHDALENLF